MAEIVIDVGARLKVIQSSVAELQHVLDGLQPNSSGFKALQKIITNMTNDMDKLRVQASKPFSSQNQFKQTEKTVDKLEDSLEKVKIAVDRIKFSDLKLSDSQTAELDNFKTKLQDIQKEFTTFKDSLKTKFLGNDFNKTFVESINPNLINKSFDEIIKNVESKVNSLGSALGSASTELKKLQSAADIGKKVDNLPKSGVMSEQFMGKDLFSKFFQTNSKGVFGFKTGGGLKKGEIQQQFFEYLQGEFQLTPGQINQLKNKSAKDIREILNADDFFNPQKEAAGKANKKLPTAGLDFTTASKNYENASAVVARLTPLMAALSNEEVSLKDKQELVNKALKDFQQDCVNSTKNSQGLNGAINGLGSQFDSFKQQLSQVNTQWLKLQSQQNTFNSMKSAIVNFMGFNQVLNLTKKAVKEAMDHIKQLDTTMNGIAIVTNMTTADLWNQVGAYSEMAQKYGTSIQGAYEVSKIYYQAGYETNEVLTLMNETLKMSKISGLDYATTTDYMMNAIKGFKMEVSEAASVVDVYSALAANTAVSQQELAEAMSKTASSMAGVGSTFEDTSAMIATMVSVTRESANNIGSAMKSIASRYGELTKDPTKLLDSEGEAMSFNKVDAALKSVGITLQTTDHQFRDFTDVIVELAEKWDTLDSAQQRYIATQFAGNRQQNRFLALVSNKDLLKENMEVAAASEDTGTLQALKALDSLESKINQVQVAYQQFYTTIGVESVWKTFLDGTRNVIDTLNNLPKLFGKIPLGAATVIYDIISLLKNIALKGLEEIVRIFQNTLQKVEQTEVNTAPIGEKINNGIINVIKGGKIKEALKEEIQVQPEKINVDKSELMQRFESIQKKYENPFFQSNHAEEYKAELLSLCQTLSLTGQNVDELKSKINSGRFGEIPGLIQTHINSLNTEATTLESVAGKWQNFRSTISNYINNSKNLSSNLSGIASALNMVGTLFDTTSRKGQKASGSLMGLAGAFRLGSVAVQAFQGTLNSIPWMAIASGIISIINGISTFIETPTERIERLTKEVEELNNKAKETKAEYNTLQRSINKLEELKEKRYESAEAAEEYQKAVDDLAEKFPQLISSLDDAGNVIINTSNVENILAKAREETTRATLNAAKSEIKLAEEKKAGIERDIEEEHARNMANILTTLPTMETAFEGDRQGRLLGLGSTLPYGPAVSEEDILINLTKNKPEYDFLEKYIDNNNIFNLDQFKTDLNENKISVNDEESQQALANLKEIYQEADSQLNEKINNMLEKAESLQGLTADELLQSENQEILKTLKEDLDSLANQNADLSSFSKQISDTILALSELSDVNNSLSGFETTIASLYVNAVDDTNKIYTIITENAQVAALATQRVVDKIENDNLDVNNEGHLFIIQQEAVEAVKEYQEFWNKLNNNQQEQFNSMLENMDKYSLDDILTTFDNFLTEPIINDLKSKYEEANENIKNRVLENIKANLGFNSQAYDQLFNSVKKIDDTDFSELDAKFINTVIAPLNKLSKQGFLNKANELEDATEKLFSSLNELDAISSTAVLDIITKNGLLTKEGINASIKAIQSDSSLNTDVVNKSLTFLETVRTTIIDNINVSIQAATSDLLNNWDTTSKELTKALSGGLDFKEADALITKAASLGVSLDLNTDFVQNGDKLILTSEKFNDYWEKLNEQSQKNADEWQQNIDQAYSLIEKIASDFDHYNFSEDEKAIIESISPDFFNNGEYFTINGYLNTAGFEALGKAIKESSEGLERYNNYAEIAAQQLKQTQEWILGDYSSLNLSPEALKELSSGKTVLKREDYTLRAARDNINSAYNSLISDVLSKGFENINLENYSGLVLENKAAIEEAIKAGNYGQFIKDYAVWAGKSITETNALITQAIAKDTQTTTGAAKDAISKLSWGPGARGFGSLSDIQALADSFNVPIESILGAYNEELNQYSFDASSLDLTSVDDFSDIVRDSIAKFIKDSFSNATKAITGKLTSSEATVFKGQLNVLGLKDLNLDFTRTTDGLKLSRQSAIDLYNELKNIDALQAQLVFSELSKSLQENDVHYTNISTTLARIAELQNEIKEMKPDDARLQMYKNELSVAQEIARTRSSTDNKDFKFMDRSLPTGMQNPIDYWNSTGEAFKAMNNAAKTGKMEIQDFYNIVQEMNNMAAVSGQTLQFMGQSLSGKAEDAASLIQAGFSALTNVKGDGVKIALGNIGTDFTTGAEAMKGDFDDGVRSMAKAQISMLDAAINMLEAIVAMEDIGDIDTSGNGEIEFGELFTFDEENKIWEYNENAQITIDKILEATDKNAELKNVLSSFYLDGYSLYELMQNKGDELTKIGSEGRQALLKAFNIINDLANSDEWDPTNLDKIYQLLEQSGLKDIFSQHVYNEAAQMSVLITPDLDLQIDWDAPNIEERLATAQVKTKEEARTILDDLAKGDTDPVKFAQALALAGQVTIDDNNVYKYHGQDFSSLEEVGKIAQEESKLDAYFVSSDTNTTTFTKTIGLQQVTIVKDENSGDITYKFADGIEITAKNEEEALHLYAQKIRDEHDSLINVSDEEILARRNLKIKEQAKIEFVETENSGSLKQQAEIIRQHTVKEINEAIENGHQEGENLVIDLGGQKITLKGTQESLKGQGEEIANQAAQDLGIDTALSQAIADGISQAFQGESGAKIGEAIKTGIQTAFGNTGTDADGVPIDNINIKPATVTIQVTDAEKDYEGIPEEGYSIPADKLPLVKAFLNSLGIDVSSAEEEYSGFRSLYVIPMADLPTVNGYLSQLGLTVVAGAEADFTGEGLTKTYTITNTKLNATGDIGTLSIDIGEPDANGNHSYGITWIGNVGDVEYTKEQLEGTAKIKKINYLYEPDENGEGTTTTEVTAIIGYTPPADGTIIAANDVQATAEVTDITFVYKKNNDTGEDELQEIKTSITDKEGNQITIPVGVDVNPAKIKSDIEQALQDAGFSKEEASANAEAIIQANANIIPSLKTDDPNYVSTITGLKEEGIELTVGAVAGTVANEVDAIIAEQEKKNIELPVKTKESPFSEYGKEGRNKLTTHRTKRNNGWQNGDLDLLLGGSNRGDTKAYINDLDNLTEAGEKISKVDFSNLEYLKHLIEQDESGNDNSEIYDQITKILSASETIESDKLNEISTFAQSFSGLEVGQLPEIATALKDIADQAGILAGIEWDKIVEGIQGVTSAQIGQPQEGGESKGGGGPSTTSTSTSTTDLLSTSSLTTAVAEIDSVIESFTSAAEQINAVVSAMGEIKTDNIDDLADAANAIKSTYAENARDAINGIRSANAVLAKSAINNISPDGAISAKEAINNISGEISLGINISVNMPQDGGGATGTVDIHSVSQGSATRSSESSVKWTQTHAYARGTLMGELGPELVVSNGRYFVVGQSGPEFVNLADDAIVFNHLQTQSLLSNGKIKTHGSPLTNERNATSLATGNAMASASDALATLKQLRSMWQSLLDASLKDMGSMGGGSGGGGGGGGGSSDAEKYVAGITSNVERWYNWLTAIETTQNKINILTKKYNLLSEQGASSQKLADNLEKQYAQLQKSYSIRKQLTKEQKAYQKSLQKDIKSGKSALSAFYQVGEDGSLLLAQDSAFSKYVSKHSTLSKSDRAKIAAGKTVKMTVKKQQAYTAAEAEEYNTKYAEDIKKGTKTKVSAGDLKESTKKTSIKIPTSGLELMKELQKTDKYGNLVYSAKEQYSILKKLGFEDYMSKDASGQAIDTSTDEGKATAVESFLSRIETDKEEYESITKSIQEQEEAALEERIQMEEINKQLKEMAKPVQGVSEHLESWYNWTRKTILAQTQLNMLATKFNNLQSQLGQTTKEQVDNLKEQAKAIQEQRDSTLKEIEERERVRKGEVQKFTEGWAAELAINNSPNAFNTKNDFLVMNGLTSSEQKKTDKKTLDKKEVAVVTQEMLEMPIRGPEFSVTQQQQKSLEKGTPVSKDKEKTEGKALEEYSEQRKQEEQQLQEELSKQPKLATRGLNAFYKYDETTGNLDYNTGEAFSTFIKRHATTSAAKTGEFTVTKRSLRTDNGSYVKKSDKLVSDWETQRETASLSSKEQKLYKQLNNNKSLSEKEFNALTKEQKKYYTKVGNKYEINTTGRTKLSELTARKADVENLDKKISEYDNGITKTQYEEAKKKVDNFKESKVAEAIRTGTTKISKDEWAKLSDKEKEEYKKYFKKDQNDNYNITTAGINLKTTAQKAYDEYETYKEIVDAYENTASYDYETTPETYNLDISDPRKFLEQLTETDVYGHTKFTKYQQAEILEQAGFADEMAKMAQIDDWEAATEEERAQAAEDYLKKIQEIPEEYNKYLDEIAEQKQKLEEQKGQIAEINNQLREMAKPAKVITDHLENWYNWTRKCTDAQNELNKLTATNEVLQKQIGDHSSDISENLQNQYDKLLKQRDAKINEREIREAELEQAKKELGNDKETSNENLKKFYTINEEGSVVYSSDTLKKPSQSISITRTTQRRDETGAEYRVIKGTNNEMTWEQYKQALERQGASEEDIQKAYDDVWNMSIVAAETNQEAISLDGVNTGQDLINFLTNEDNGLSAENVAEVLHAYGLDDLLKTIDGQYYFSNWDEADSDTRAAAGEAWLSYMQSYPDKINGASDAIADLDVEIINLNGDLLDVNAKIKELAEVSAGIQSPFEEWYEWIRKTVQEQHQLNLLTKEYSNLQKDRSQTQGLGTNLLNQLKEYTAQLNLIKNEQGNGYLKDVQNKFDKLSLNDNNPYAKIFQYDETNGLQFKQDFKDSDFKDSNFEEAFKKVMVEGIKITNKTAEFNEEEDVYKTSVADAITDFTFNSFQEFIDKLTEQDLNNQMKYNTDQQFALLKTAGFANLMEYDSSGNKIFENGIENATKEERKNAVQAFLDNIKNFQDDFNATEDKINELEETQKDLAGSVIDIKNQLQDNEVSLENLVLQAIEDREQVAIDTLKEQKDMLADASNRFIDGLNDQLSKEKEMYESQESQNELTKLQRQLAVLQRTGGSASQIRSLQDQISAQQKDLYFDERQQQIDAIQEASDAEIERLDKQIAIAEEALTYSKENGLYWAEVREIMNGSADSIQQFIETNLKERKSQSTLQGEIAITGDGKLISTYTETRNQYKKGGLIDFTGPAWVDGSKTKPEAILTASQTKFLQTDLIKQLESFVGAITDFDKDSKESARQADIRNSLAIEQAQAITEIEITATKQMLEDINKQYKESKTSYLESLKDMSQVELSSIQAVSETFSKLQDVMNSKNIDHIESLEEVIKTMQQTATDTIVSYKELSDQEQKVVLEQTVESIKEAKDINEALKTTLQTLYQQNSQTIEPSVESIMTDLKKIESAIDRKTQLSSLVDKQQTLIDISTIHKEMQKQTEIFKTLMDMQKREEIIQISQLNFEMKVGDIASDYDAKRAGQIAFDEMVRIARKTGKRSVSRR